MQCGCEARDGEFRTCLPADEVHACARETLYDDTGDFVEGASCRWDSQCDSGQCGCMPDDVFERQCLPPGHQSDCTHHQRCDDWSDCASGFICGCRGGYERQCLMPVYEDSSCTWGQDERPALGCRSGSLHRNTPGYLGLIYTEEGDCLQRSREDASADQQCSWYICENGSDSWMTRVGDAGGIVTEAELDAACGTLFSANASGCPQPIVVPPDWL